ncbi:Armadillo-type fold,Symplekin C-terminal,Symplekin/Pta1, N-terminal,Armadillo-like [Cinara cedri]|uniref:Armadillo-type fold,Symplekin C-terminal,Symplekin/Pta1, N-terminal,Armadillo-like n=1 Tax=Cinara cedri TaxID=506608 RepID=A0A5E4MJD8_9HEMI|nr:Armadillo-type fold,Symplekin C-terminal,Symplekin/Pta1, N-terminal,Armadillo-like [Cinara cedri]
MRADQNQSTSEQVTALLNEAAVTPDENTKLDLLYKVKEVLLYQEPKLLTQFITDVIAYQHDHKTMIRKFIVVFIEECCNKDKSNVCITLPNLLMLLTDRSPIVLKRVVQAACYVYRAGLKWISMTDLPSSDISNVWQDLSNLKSYVINMIDNDNGGIRTQVIKFLETVILVQTYKGEGGLYHDNDMSLEDIPLTLKVTRRRRLEDEARVLFDLLSRFCSSGNVGCANLITCMNSLSLIAKWRVPFIEKVLTSFETLTKNLPNSLKQSQKNSVLKNLKMQLLQLLRLPSSTEYQQTIGRLLLDIGASNQEIMKALQVLSKNDDSKKLLRSLKRKNEDKDDKKLDKEDIPEKKRCTEGIIFQDPNINIVKAWILEKFTPESITNLVMLFMPKLPSKMPLAFSANYSPIAAAGTDNHIQHVAKLLATQLCCSDVVIPGLQYIKKEDYEFIDEKNEEIIKMEDDDMLLNQPAELNLENCLIDPTEAEELSLDALLRILDTSKIVLSKQFKEVHTKAITKIAVMCGDDYRNTILDYINLDMVNNMDLCLSWLYEEYSVTQGFIKLPTAFRNTLSSEQNYNTVLCSLIRAALGIEDLKEKEDVLTTLYFESPFITDDAVEILKEISPDLPFGLTILNELVTKRPPRHLLYLNALLFFTSHKNEQLREVALNFISKLYDYKDLKNIIEEYATFYLGFLRLQIPPEVLFGKGTGRLPKSEIWDEDSITACLYLYFMLMPYNYELIHELATVFTYTQGEVKRTIIKLLPQPLQNIPMNSAEIFRLLEDLPKGAEAMIIRILHILTEKETPSIELISRVKKLYDKQIVEVRFLVPILPGLDKKYILNALPQLIKLNPNVVKEIFNRILGINYSSSNTNPPVSPAELLIALHTMDSDPNDLKYIIKATSLCFAEKSVFTQEVLAIVMQNLMDVNPLPTLLMRTVIQSLTTYPQLIGFIMNILQRLILKKVWHQKTQWEGFVKCCQKTKPNSFQVLLQLPPKQLDDVLCQCPEMRKLLLDHVLSFTEVQRSHIRQAIMDVIFGNQLEVPMYQNLKVKCEPMPKIMNQSASVITQEKQLTEKILDLNEDELRPPGDCDEDSINGI